MQWDIFTFICGTLLLSRPCDAAARDEKDICTQPAETGLCKAYMPRYFFNAESQKCEEFIYGGCMGNANNFLSENECTAQCGRTINKCHLPPKIGICRGFFRRYFYNITTRMCEEFVYGGCDGNTNNFMDITSCQMECNPNSLLPSFCIKHKDRGTCGADIPRFYYNRETNSCEKFSYTGCGGNDNNFFSLKDCQKICSPLSSSVRKVPKKKSSTPRRYKYIVLKKRFPLL